VIDIELLRTQPDHVAALIAKKDPSYDTQKLIKLDEAHRAMQRDVEMLRQQKNELARQGKAGITPELREESIRIGKELKEKEVVLADVEAQFRAYYLECPNMPQDDVPVGGKESNRVVKTVGSKPTFNFPVKNHVELGEALGWFDFKAAASLAGSNFALYKKQAVSLTYALALFMLKHNKEHGFEPILPSVLVNGHSLEVTGNFPKFKDQVYAVTEDKLYLTPTSEINLTNLYRDHIIPGEQLPIHMTAWTSCFRREAGTYGATERGLIRIHQFEKVELVTICEPEKSNDELDRMVACAESILQKLGLHYRISLLAGQDCSFQSTKTYDIEVWLPGQGQFYEVSSASNCGDFQSRRGLIRFKKHVDSKTQLVHTLNASSLALPRLIVALMETYQQADGTIALPKVLTDLMI
jgi:seryl-tRNA synthetase